MTNKVSIIIPTRNEERFIVDTLKSILNQDYPADLLEIIVADGESDDQTPALIKDVIKQHPNVVLINNPERVVPFALNYAIERATGDFIVRMDSHSVYPINYVSSLINESIRLKADNVGARVIAQPVNEGMVAVSIALAISHPLGVGNSSFRLEGTESLEVDTVPFGCFPRSLFERIGMFDTDLIRNQDDEFNGRIIKNGGKIFLVPHLSIAYFARDTVSKMMKMFYQYGLFKPLVNEKLGAAATLRQFIPPLFVLFLLFGFTLVFLPFYADYSWGLMLMLYAIITLLVSFTIANKNKRIGLVFLLPFIFPLIHLSYGFGYLKGLFMLKVLNTNPGGRNFSTSR